MKRRGPVPFTFLVERTNDNGEPVLSGMLGRAEIIGQLAEPTNNGSRRWCLMLVEPDERALARRARYRALAQGEPE